MTLAGFTGIGRLDNVQGCKAHMCVQKRGCGEAACGNKGSPGRTIVESLHVLLQVILQVNFQSCTPGESFLAPVLHIPVDSGQDLDLRSCNVHGGSTG